MFSIRLRELRETAGYKSQQSFADAFGVAQSTVGNWEAGKREPNYETTLRLADFFHVSVDYLMGRDDTKDEKKAPEPKTVQRRIMCYGGGVSEETVISEEEYETLQAVLKTLREQQKKRDASK